MEPLFLFAMLELSCFSFCCAFARIFFLFFLPCFCMHFFWAPYPYSLKFEGYEIMRSIWRLLVDAKSEMDHLHLTLYSSYQQKMIFLLNETQNLTKLKTYLRALCS